MKIKYLPHELREVLSGIALLGTILLCASNTNLQAIIIREYPVPSSWGSPVEWTMAEEKALLLDRFADAGGRLRRLDPVNDTIEWTHDIPSGCLNGNFFIFHQADSQILVEIQARSSSYQPGTLRSLYWLDSLSGKSEWIFLEAAFQSHGLEVSQFSVNSTLYFGDTIVVAGDYMEPGFSSRTFVLYWIREGSAWKPYFQQSLPEMLSTEVLACERASLPGETPVLVTVDEDHPENPPGPGRKFFTFRTFRLTAGQSWQKESEAILPLSEVDTKINTHLPLKNREGAAFFPSYRAGGDLFAVNFSIGESAWNALQVYDYQPRGSLVAVEPGLVIVNLDGASYMLTEELFGWKSTYLMSGNAFNPSIYDTRCSSQRIVSMAATGDHILVHDFRWDGMVTEPWFPDIPLVNGCQFVDWLGWITLGPRIGSDGTWAYLKDIGWTAIYGHDHNSFWAFDLFAGFCHYRPEAWDRPKDQRFVFVEKLHRFVPVRVQPDGSRRFYDSDRDHWFSSYRVPALDSYSFPWEQVIGDEFNNMTFYEDGSFHVTQTETIDGQAVPMTIFGTMTYLPDEIFPSAAKLVLNMAYLTFLYEGQQIQLTIPELAALAQEPFPQTWEVEIQLWGPDSGEYTASGYNTNGELIFQETAGF